MLTGSRTRTRCAVIPAGARLRSDVATGLGSKRKPGVAFEPAAVSSAPSQAASKRRSRVILRLSLKMDGILSDGSPTCQVGYRSRRMRLRLAPSKKLPFVQLQQRLELPIRSTGR